MENNSDRRKIWREQKQAYRKNRKEYTLVFSLEESKQLELFSKEKNMHVSEFVKSVLKAYKNNTGYIIPKENTLKELILEMRRIGNNVNQTVRWINTNKAINIYNIQQLQKHLSELEKKIIDSLTTPLKINDH